MLFVCYNLMEFKEELGFCFSSNFVPERYSVSKTLRDDLIQKGFCEK